ncbi:MAG: branched-chain amino acid ABC transporter permease [Rubrobacter sp.]|nr:branched-chain amino acid ABC transporter permease [Rubrobacter sp.]
MTLFLQQLVNGIALGGVYGLAALGLTLVFGVLRIPNFAHGALYMVGAYVAYLALAVYGVPYPVAIALSAVVLAAVGALLERLVFYPLRDAPHTHAMIGAIGVLLFLTSGAQLLFGADFRQMPTPFDGTVRFLGLGVTEQRLVIILASVVLMAGLYLFLKRTVPGQTIEAIEQDKVGAMLVGISVSRVSMMTFAISAALAAVAAALIAPINLVYPTMGDILNLKAFAIVVLGGMGSVPGAIVGGFALALAETFGATYVSSDFGDLIGFLFLVVVLAVRPAGLFARGT